MTGAAPDRRQDKRAACVMCTHGAIRHYRADRGDAGCNDCNCPGYEPDDLAAASPVPGQQREAVARPRWIDGEMREPWFRDLIAGTTAEHAADLTGWAETIAHTYSRSGTLEITAVVWALLDRIDALLAATRDGEQA